jgi:hypothetical protein
MTLNLLPHSYPHPAKTPFIFPNSCLGVDRLVVSKLLKPPVSQCVSYVKQRRMSFE